MKLVTIEIGNKIDIVATISNPKLIKKVCRLLIFYPTIDWSITKINSTDKTKFKSFMKIVYYYTFKLFQI